MKKIALLLASVLLICLFAVPVFAETQTEGTTPPPAGEGTGGGALTVPEAVEKVIVQGIAAPVATETPALLTEDMIDMITTGENKMTKGAAGDFAVIHQVWTDETSGLSLQAGDVFEGGKDYALKITLSFSDAALVKWEKGLSSDIPFFLNQKQQVKPLSNYVEKKVDENATVYVLSCPFSCEAISHSPTVSLKVEGETEKEYDGASILLTAQVEKKAGMVYRLEWYRDEAVLKGAEEEILSLLHVKDSGKYACKVYVSAESAPDRELGFSWTEEVTVTISQHPITIQIANEEKNVLDEDPIFNYTVQGDVYDALTGKPERAQGEDIGEYAITIGSIAFAEDVADNYMIRVLPGTLKILKEGEIPFVSVLLPSDMSHITGESGSTIRVQATKGFLSEGMTLMMIHDPQLVQKLEEVSGKKHLKSFTVSVMENNKEIEIPKYAAVRFEIPLTAEESKMIFEGQVAGLYRDGKLSYVNFSRVENGAVAYIDLEIGASGVVVLFEGKAEISAPEETVESTEAAAELPEKKNNTFLWVLTVLLSLLALGGIVFTIVWTSKNRPAKKAVPSQAPSQRKLGPEEAAEKERKRRIADEMNSLPPIPDGKKTRPAEKTEVPPKKKNVISFDDLED